MPETTVAVRDFSHSEDRQEVDKKWPVREDAGSGQEGNIPT
jgi:hypothetical protein